MSPQAARLWAQPLLSRGAALSRPSASHRSSPALRSFFTSAKPSIQPRGPSGFFEQRTLFFVRREPLPLARHFRFLRFKSHKPNATQNPNPTPHLGSPAPAPSLSQRLKKLSREYGWSAVGVYLALSALDFPFCFLAVRMLGTDRIGHYEHVIIEAFWKVLRIPFPNLGKKSEPEGSPVTDEIVEATAREGALGWSAEVEQAEANNSGAEASLWTQLALAYAVHKSFIFIRVPLTAAVLPKVVKTLRGWGWNIGKRTPKSV